MNNIIGHAEEQTSFDRQCGSSWLLSDIKRTEFKQRSLEAVWRIDWEGERPSQRDQLRVQSCQ